MNRFLRILIVALLASACCRAEDPPAKLQLDFANGLYQREYYPMAVEEYRKFLKEFPDAPGTDEAAYRLGESLRNLKQSEEALTAYLIVAEKFPNSPYWQKSKFRVGELNYLGQKYPEATKHLQELEPKATDKEIHAAALFLLGKIQYDQGQLDGAAKALSSLAQSPEAGVYAGYSYFTLAQIALKKNEPDKALGYFKQTLDVKPSETLVPETRYEIARLEFNRQHWAAAAAGYQQMIVDHPKSPFVAASVNGLVAALFQEGKWEECAKAVNAYLDRALPQAQPDLLYLAANAQRQLKQWDNAIAKYDQILKHHPAWDRLDTALFEMIRCAYEKKDPSSVVNGANEFLRGFPKSQYASAVALLAGESQLAQKQFADAIQFYDVVLANYPKSPEAPDAAYRKGLCLASLEKWADASATFRMFAQNWASDPRAAEVTARSGQAQQRASNYPEAIKDYAAFAGKYPTHALAESVLFQLGLCYGETKQFDEMSATLKKLLQQFPKTASLAEANYWLGWNGYRLKQWAEAVPHLTLALASPTRAKDAKLKLALSYFELDQAANAAPLVKEFFHTDSAREIPLGVYRWLGEFHVAAGRHGEALAMYQQMATLVDAKAMPGWAVTAHLGVGQCALVLQKNDTALAAFQKVVELAPESAQGIEALMGEARAYLATQKYQEGENVLNNVLTLQPEGRDNARARMLLGELLMAQSKYAEAAKHFQTVALLFDDPEVTPRALASAAKCFESAGQTDEVKKTLDELKQRFPKFQAQ